jgi:hypothetical protein
MKPNGASKSGDFEVNVVPNFELEISMHVVYVALLLALCNSQILSHWVTPLGSFIFAGPKNDLSRTSDHISEVLHFLPYKAPNGDILRLAW